MTPEGPFAEIPVVIKNWAESAKPPRVANTTVQTVVIDSAGVAGGVPRNLQIAVYESNRLRLVVQPLDHDVVLCKAVPVVSPDPAITAGSTPVGRLLPTGAPTNFYEYEFYGPDAWWINSMSGGATRVTITKEYS